MKRFKFLGDFWKIKKPGNFDRAAFRMGGGELFVQDVLGDFKDFSCEFLSLG